MQQNKSIIKLRWSIFSTTVHCSNVAGGEDLPEFHFVRALAQSPVASKVRGAIVVETPLAAAATEQLQICIEDTKTQLSSSCTRS